MTEEIIKGMSAEEREQFLIQLERKVAHPRATVKTRRAAIRLCFDMGRAEGSLETCEKLRGTAPPADVELPGESSAATDIVRQAVVNVLSRAISGAPAEGSVDATEFPYRP